MGVDALPHKVYYKFSWADDWTLGEFLYAERIVFALAPAIPHAELFYRAGEHIMRPGDTIFRQYDRLTLQGYYVKIEIQQPAGEPYRWYGIVVDRHEVLGGHQFTDFQYSRQTFTAYGLEFLLERKRLTSSLVEQSNGGVAIGVNRAIGFNLGGGNEHDHKRVDNRTQNVGVDGHYLFVDAVWAGSPWKGDDIIDYLVGYHMPKDINDDSLIPWNFDRLAAKVSYIVPPLQAQGRTIREVFNMLMDRRRGLSWYVRVRPHALNSEHDDVDIIPISFSEVEIMLPSHEGVLPANETRVPLDFDSDLLAREPSLITSRSVVYKHVVVRAERAGTVFTAAYNAPHVKNWTTDRQDEYNAGASADPDYATLDDDMAKRERNREARQVAKLESVYRYFVVPDTWNGRIDGTPVFPIIDDGVNFHGWVPGLRFQHHLPIREGIDVTGDNIAAGTIESLLPDNKQGDFKRPMGWIRVGNDGEEDIYEQIDKLGQGLRDGLISEDTLGHAFSMSLKMEHDSLGFQIDVHGAAQHAIAHDDFVPADTDGADDNDPLGESDLDYKDILVTVYMLVDAWCEGSWPDPDNGPDADDVHSTLYIQTRDYYLDYVPRDTVVDVSSRGRLLRTTAEGYIRDDREKLQDMARIAYQWFGQERKAIELTVHTLDSTHFDNLSIGDLITTIGFIDPDPLLAQPLETINSVVTELSLDTRAQTTTIKTQFAELDVGNLVGRGDK